MDIHALLKNMTLEQKLAQMSQYGTSVLYSGAEDDVTGPARDLGLPAAHIAAAGSTLGSGTAEMVIAMQKDHLAKDPNKIPLLFMRDVIHGYRTIYPIPLGMGATWDEGIVYECCRMAAKESAVSGITVNFSPMVDLVRDCRWGRNMETTGEDAWYNSRMAATMVKGYQGDDLTGKYDIAACVKHFAAYGAAESGRDYYTTDMSDYTLYEHYMPAYRAAVDAGVEMVMTSFNALNGVPCAGNPWLVKDLLRGEWGFDGVVISDWNSFYEMISHGFVENGKQAAEKALNGGTDIEMMSSTYIHYVKELIEEGKVSEEQIDRAVLRILKLKEKLGLFENPLRATSVEEEEKYCLCEEHRAIARRAAEQAAVLLKNDGVLPLSESIRSLAVIGPFADCGMNGWWSCQGKTEESVSVAAGLRAALPHASITCVAGCVDSLHGQTDATMLEEAVAAARGAEAVVLCLGVQEAWSGEGNSRADVGLPAVQKELLRRVAAVNPNTVVLLFNGRPLALGDVIDDAPAFFTMWQPGTEGGSAAARLLLGRVNFSGHLTMTFPYHVGQAPIYYNSMRTGRPKPGEDSTVGYVSRYVDMPNAPLFPFGYGLSYNTYAYSEPTLSASTLKKGGGEPITLSVTVRNTGKVAGTTVVQLYIRDLVASLVRPVRELRGYERVTLAAGEERTVTFTVDEGMLAFRTESGKVEAEVGDFHLWASPDSASGEPAVLKLV